MWVYRGKRDSRLKIGRFLPKSGGVGILVYCKFTEWGPLVNSELGWGPGSVEPVEPAVATPLMECM